MTIDNQEGTAPTEIPTITTTRYRIESGSDWMELFRSYGVRDVYFECNRARSEEKVKIPCKLESIIPESGGGNCWVIEGSYIFADSPENNRKKFVGFYRSNGPSTFNGETSCGYLDLVK